MKIDFDKLSKEKSNPNTLGIVVICATDYYNFGNIETMLDSIVRDFEVEGYEITILDGGYSKGEKYIKSYCDIRNFQNVSIKPNFELYGKSAFIERNRNLMIKLAAFYKEKLVLVFDENNSVRFDIIKKEAEDSSLNIFRMDT